MTHEQAVTLSFFMVITRHRTSRFPWSGPVRFPTRYAADVAYFAYRRLQQKAGVTRVF
jgi:hypothetical protein